MLPSIDSTLWSKGQNSINPQANCFQNLLKAHINIKTKGTNGPWKCSLISIPTYIYTWHLYGTPWYIDHSAEMEFKIIERQKEQTQQTEAARSFREQVGLKPFLEAYMRCIKDIWKNKLTKNLKGPQFFNTRAQMAPKIWLILNAGIN